MAKRQVVVKWNQGGFLGHFSATDPRRWSTRCRGSCGITRHWRRRRPQFHELLLHWRPSPFTGVAIWQFLEILVPSNHPPSYLQRNTHGKPCVFFIRISLISFDDCILIQFSKRNRCVVQSVERLTAEEMAGLLLTFCVAILGASTRHSPATVQEKRPFVAQDSNYMLVAQTCACFCVCVWFHVLLCWYVFYELSCLALLSQWLLDYNSSYILNSSWLCTTFLASSSPSPFLPHPACRIEGKHTVWEINWRFFRDVALGCMNLFDLDVKSCCSSVACSKYLRLKDLDLLKAMSSFWVKHGAVLSRRWPRTPSFRWANCEFV